VKNVFPLAGDDLNNEFIASGNFAFITGDNKMYTWSIPRTMQQVNDPEHPVPYMPDWDITYIRIIWQGDSASRSSNVNQFFITADGTLWGMGDNANGELSDGTKIRRNEPVEIKRDVVAIIPRTPQDYGSHHRSLNIILGDGSLWRWVYDGYFTPQMTLENIINHTGRFFITADGHVVSVTRNALDAANADITKIFDETVATPNYLIHNLSE